MVSEQGQGSFITPSRPSDPQATTDGVGGGGYEDGELRERRPRVLAAEATILEQYGDLPRDQLDMMVDDLLARELREATRAAREMRRGLQAEAVRAAEIAHREQDTTKAYGNFKFGVDKITVLPLLEGRHDLQRWINSIRPQLEVTDL